MSASARVCFGILALALAAPDEARPEAPETANPGLEIMRRVDALSRASDYSARATWRLIEAGGGERVRETRVFRRDDAADSDYESRWLIIVDSPRIVKDTGLLVWNARQAGGEDQTWLYLPSFRKVRRIAGRKREDPFLGSDFSFVDLSERRAEDGRHTLLREETVDGTVLDVVESIPVGDDFYGRRLHWIDRETATPVRTQLFDESGRHVKTLEREWTRIEGFWSWRRLEMSTLRSGHRTVIDLDGIEVDRGLSDDVFTPTSLRLGVR